MSTSTTLSLPSGLLADVYGPSLISSWIAMCLYGLTTTQTYIYWVNYPKDGRWTKALVLFLWILNTAHSVCMCHTCYYHLIVTASDPNLILLNVWSFTMTALLYVIVAVIVMLYYVKLIFHLSNNHLRWWLTGAIMIPILLFFAFALDTCVQAFLSMNLEQSVGYVHDAILPCLVTQVISDGSITGILCVLLYAKRTEFKRTRHIINALIIYAASRGLMTLAITLIMVLALAINPDEIWYVAAEFVAVGLYTNSLMTVLNTRRHTCETAERPSTDGLERNPHSGLSSGRSQDGIYIERKATDIESLEFGSRDTSHDDYNKIVAVKPVV